MSRPRRKVKSQRFYALELMEQRYLLSSVVDNSGFPAGYVNYPIGFTHGAVGSIHSLDTPQDGGSATPVGVLTPDQIRDAYGMNLINFGSIVGDGTGQTIAIVDAYDDPNAAADLHTFDQYYGLPDPPTFLKLNQEGQTSPLPGVDPADSWEGEESLDIEWAHAMAPGANIYLFEADDDSDNLDDTVPVAAHTPGVSVVSMSFGGAEFPGETLEDSFFTTPTGHTGITFASGAGDTGIYVPGDSTGTLIETVYPAASPNVVAVGGTTLNVSGDQYAGETGWGYGTNSGVEGGTGGGISLYEPKPEYQDFLDNQSETNRAYPDVALEADPATGVPIVDSYDYGSATPWAIGPTGGTSLATPLFAGEIAVADQGRVINGFGTLFGSSQTLPRIYQSPDADFHDVTVGNNGYLAGTGYDLVTGRGSPVANLFLTDLSENFVGFHVFTDLNVDGIQDDGETGQVGVQVQLKTAGPDGIIGTSDDVLVATTTTDDDGLYEFTNIAPGTYFVHFTLPLGYKISPIGDSTMETTNNVLDVNGNSGPITVTPTTYDPLVNGGMHTDTVSINDVTIDRAHSGLTPMVFTVTLYPQNPEVTDVPYTTEDDTATAANNDYIPTSGVLVFPAGVLAETITVEAVGNLTIENDVDFHVNITAPDGFFPLKTVGVGTIINTNFPEAAIAGTPTLKRSATQILNFQFLVSLSAPAPFDVLVPYNTSDGSAVANVDYLPTSGTLDFSAHTTGPLTVDVQVYAGTNRQLDKTFYLNVGASSTVTVGTPSQAIGTILTNEPPGISVEPAQVTESPTASVFYLPFNVDVAPSLTGVITVNYATSDGTAVAGKDYTAESGTLSFAPGRIQDTVYVPVSQQFIAQQDKTVNFTISNPVGNVLLLNTAVTGTIHYITLAAVPFSARQKATYFDGLNQRVTVGLKGAGTGDVIFIGSSSNATNAFEILTSGTNAASAVTVQVGGGGQTSVDNFIATGTLGSLIAPTMNVLSSVAISGGLESLKLGYVAGAAVTIGTGNAGMAAALSFNRVLNSTITSAIPISLITAGAYLNTTGSALDITAPKVGTVKVKGNFGGTIVSTSVASLIVGGTIDDGAVLATGSIGSVTAASITGSTFLAGVSSDLTGAPASKADFINEASLIGKIKVRGGVFSDNVIAGWNVQSVAIGVTAGTTATDDVTAVTANHVGNVSAGSDSVKNPATESAFKGISVDLV